MHAERRVPPRRVRYLDRRDRRTILAKVTRIGADPGTPPLDCGTKASSLQLTHAVGCQEYAGADFAECGRLFIYGDPEAVRYQRIRREQPANSASNNHDVGTRCRHHQLLVDQRRMQWYILT